MKTNNPQEKRSITLTTELILFLKDLLDAFDPYGVEHGVRVAELAVKLAKWEGVALDSQELKDIFTAGLLHDIGKIMIPGDILRIPGKYLQSEYDIMSLHAINGYKMLMRIVNGTTINMNVALIVKFHHKNFDGSGYPNDDVQGNRIPLGARVLRIVDSYDAITQERGYRPTLNNDNALLDMIDWQIKYVCYDPDLLQLFLKMMKDG